MSIPITFPLSTEFTKHFVQIVAAACFCYSAPRASLVWSILPVNDVQLDPEPCFFRPRTRVKDMYVLDRASECVPAYMAWHGSWGKLTCFGRILQRSIRVRMSVRRGGGETRRSESFDDNIDINGYHRGTVGITVDADGVGHLELPPTWTDSALVEIVAPQTLLASFLRVSTTHEIE
ncbi:unnamed protein product [Fusarium graminearum]|uniref:Uncharacterized protein n=1 Tax=Gibberella zeae TaxID=5518 RepID=A0A9N8NG17_GIBZA|nr:unnamed protein product [Fusarium graminearum]CAG1972174.1 unnamed protein product [Fusarium graminearum]CAG1998192.1 unnamed protein product [Fusarium graminearum]